jgi:hypothetical protein
MVLLIARQETVPDRARAQSSRRRIRLSEIIVGLILLALLTVVVSELWTGSTDAVRTNPDLMYDYVSARELRSGGNPYDSSQALMETHISPDVQFDLDPSVANPHTPFQILLLAPLSLLGWVTAKNIWLIIDVALLMVSAFIVCRELRFSMPATVVVTLGCAMVPLAKLEFVHGQVGTLLLLLFVIGWFAQRRGNEALCGFALGIAAALKLYPALMLIPLVRSGSRKTALWLVGTAALVLVSSSLLIGPGAALDFLQVSRHNVEIWAGAPANVSVVSLPYRLLGSVLGFHLPTSIGAGIALVLGCGGLLLIYRSRGARSNDFYWGSLPWIVVLSPIAWDHYLLLLLPLIVLQVRSYERLHDVPILLRIGIAMTILGTTGVGLLLGSFVPYETPLLGIVPMLGALVLGSYEMGALPSRPPAACLAEHWTETGIDVAQDSDQ